MGRRIHGARPENDSENCSELPPINSGPPMSTLPALIEAIGPFPVDALIVVDNADVRPLQRVAPENVIIRGQPVLISKVLQHCDVAILNRKHGTVAEFLLAGIPLLVIPLSLEQAVTGKRLEGKKLGAAAGPERIDIIQHQLRAIIDRPDVLHGTKQFQEANSQTTDLQRIERVYKVLARNDDSFPRRRRRKIKTHRSPDRH